MGMLQINGLFSPINEVLAKDVKYHRLNKDSPLTLALEDALLIFQLVTDNPTPIQQVVPQEPEVIIFVDAYKSGAGGTIYCTSEGLTPLIFRIPFPDEVQQMLEKQLKGNKNVTISDLEVFRFIAGFIAVALSNLLR